MYRRRKIQPLKGASLFVKRKRNIGLKRRSVLLRRKMRYKRSNYQIRKRQIVKTGFRKFRKYRLFRTRKPMIKENSPRSARMCIKHIVSLDVSFPVFDDETQPHGYKQYIMQGSLTKCFQAGQEQHRKF